MGCRSMVEDWRLAGDVDMWEWEGSFCGSENSGGLVAVEASGNAEMDWYLVMRRLRS